jgi:hypothetical protein
VTVRGEFGARVVCRDLREETLEFGPIRIDTMLLSHPGYCLGYRLNAPGHNICYITDNELYRSGHPRHNKRYAEQLAAFAETRSVLTQLGSQVQCEAPSEGTAVLL